MNPMWLMLLAFAMAIMGQRSDHEEWETFKVKFKKQYNHSKEETMRKHEFLKTHRVIEQHNKGNHSWKLEHNHFSDLTDSEKQNFLGHKEEYSSSGKSLDVLTAELTYLTPANRLLPTSFDLRTTGCIAPIQNQGQCGSCWAFVAIATLEYAKCKKTKILEKLSEQQLVSCDSQSFGCNGGYYRLAWLNYLRVNGSQTAASYPYKSGTSKVSEKCSFNKTYVKAFTAGTATSPLYTDIDPINGNNALIMAALVDKGVLGTSLMVINSLYNYKSGVYDDKACDSNDTNHAVNIVGYGVTLLGVPYWICRNSWGASWGASGYFLIRRGVNRCNIEKRAAYVNAA